MSSRMRPMGWLCWVLWNISFVASASASASASVQEAGGGGAPGVPSWAEPASQPLAVEKVRSPLSRPASRFEMNSLYFASALYGVQVGLWLDAELNLKDPSKFLLAPAVLGVGLPVAVYLSSQPKMLRGKPATLVVGAALGALEAMAVVGLQRANSDDHWGGQAVGRALVLGTTAGAIGGYVLGEYQQPSPRISGFVLSGAFLGMYMGGLVGVGLAGDGSELRGGSKGVVLGLNAGLLASMGLSTLFVPTSSQLTWMWLGAGIGSVIAAPVLLFYVRKDAPPLRTGLPFVAAATGLGALAAGVFGPSWGGDLGSWSGPDWLRVYAVAPMVLPGGGGLSFSGSLL